MEDKVRIHNDLAEKKHILKKNKKEREDAVQLVYCTTLYLGGNNHFHKQEKTRWQRTDKVIDLQDRSQER